MPTIEDLKRFLLNRRATIPDVSSARVPLRQANDCLGKSPLLKRCVDAHLLRESVPEVQLFESPFARELYCQLHDVEGVLPLSRSLVVQE